ncbi:SH2 domain-containing protein 1B, partial [Fukomys damarensis]
FNNCVYTYRIFRENQGYRVESTEGFPKLTFPNLKELVSKFKNPDQGLVVHLSKPIKRPSLCLRQRRSLLVPNGIYGKSF